MKTRILILGLFTLCVACASQPGTQERNPSSVASAAQFCTNLQSTPPSQGMSLRHLRQSFTQLGLIKEGVSLGARANQASKAFASAGFEDTLKGNANQLDNPSEITNGSVFLLRHSKACSRVSKANGHVAVQCDGKMILVQGDFRAVSHADYKDCVYSVQRHPAWSNADPELEGDDIEGQEAHP